MKSEDRKSSTKGLFQALFLLRLPPTPQTAHPLLLSFPSPTCTRASLHLELSILKAGVFYDNQRQSQSGGTRRPGELHKCSPTLACQGLGRDSEPSYSPGAPPLLYCSLPPPGAPPLGHHSSLPVLSSSPSYLSPFLRTFLVDPLLWLLVQTTLKHLNLPSLGLSLKWPLPDLEIPSLCRLPLAIILHTSQVSGARVCAHDYFRWYTSKPFFNLTVYINFNVY